MTKLDEIRQQAKVLAKRGKVTSYEIMELVRSYAIVAVAEAHAMHDGDRSDERERIKQAYMDIVVRPLFNAIDNP